MAAKKDQPSRYRKAMDIKVGDQIMMRLIGEDGYPVFDAGMTIQTVTRVETPKPGRHYFYDEAGHRAFGMSREFIEGQF